MIFAVVPAAGQSVRMGAPKLVLKLGDRAVLERVVTALREGGVDRVVVVAGPHVPELTPIASAAGADVCLLAEPTPDMRATVEAGLRWLEENVGPRPSDDWFLAPADHPTLNPDVVRQMIASGGDGSIVVPTYRGRRGHPTLFSWRHVAGIHNLPADLGINAYLRSHAAEVLELPVDDPEVHTDLDTPEDFERLRSLFVK